MLLFITIKIINQKILISDDTKNIKHEQQYINLRDSYLLDPTASELRIKSHIKTRFSFVMLPNTEKLQTCP